MVDPALALLLFAALVTALAAAFWPSYGVVPRLRRLAHLSERVLMEDALKHVYMRERMGRPCSLESLTSSS